MPPPHSHPGWPLGSAAARVFSHPGRPQGSWAIDSLLDSGADDSVFPEAFGAKIGLDLRHAPQGRATGATLAGVPLRYAQVILRLTDGREFREWPAWVGFTSVPLTYPMLGFAGFLQFFNAYLLGDHEEVELTVNRLYPGS